MTIQSQTRILRNYRNLSPSRFHAFNQRVRKSLADNKSIPESTWGANPSLLMSYFTASDRHDAVHHESHYRSVLVIAQRDLLQTQIVNYLDEIAADLEAEAVRNPALLVSSGFDLAKERRRSPRANAAKAASEAATEPDGSNP